MNIRIIWYLVNELKSKHNNVSITYGYITKNHRIQNGIEKSHLNDAFAIAKGTNQARTKDRFLVIQDRLKNRSLEKFYDSKIIDIRTEKKVSGGDLNCGRSTRNKNLNTENLRKYRGVKISKGQLELAKFFWKEKTFWSDGYFSCSIGNVSKETIEKYIQNQC